ncbi:MAG: putative DNA binding domain-containing protein [Solobacterium sp.]|nr:putative DNA binding domain-containing protein [Solobacterium sp.]
MALPIQINNLIHGRTVESTRIEFKKGFNPDSIIRTICAFANDIDNTGGGYIVLGVEDQDGSIKYPIKGLPQKEIDQDLKKLREYCHYIEPLYEPIVEPILYEDVHLIVIWVPGGIGRPYKAPKEVTKKGSIKNYYIRKFSSTVVASSDEEKELFYVSQTIPFDDQANLRANINDLDIGLLRSHLNEVGSELFEQSLHMSLEDIARNMQILDGPSEHVKPKNVGILMFSEKINEYFRYARIEVVDIPDPTGNGMVEKIFTGPIQRQLKDALSFIHNYVIKEKIIKVDNKAESIRIFNYPFKAIEEILSNAIYHKSYQINEPIIVRIERNKIEITSCPGFDRSITDEKIKKGDFRSNKYRNRRIGDFLKELKLIEGRNTGFPNAKEALKKNGSKPLQIEMDEERTYLTVTILVHEAFEDKRDTSYEDEIITLLKDEPRTLTELSKAMGYKAISKKLSRTVKYLNDTDEITSFVEERNVKYRVK